MSEFPHLADSSPEFIALADVKATIHEVKIPMHSHVLAKSSKVFAQLFSTFNDGSGFAAPISVTRFFDDESIQSVLLTLTIFYEPTLYCVETVFQRNRWPVAEKFGQPTIPSPRLCDPVITPPVLQSVMKLLDKLDAAPLLKFIDDTIDVIRNYENFNGTPWYGVDPVGYFLLGQRLGLGVAAVSLECIVDILMKKPPSESYRPAEEAGTASTNALAAINILVDPRWCSDSSMLLLVIEAMSVHHDRANHHFDRHDPPKKFLDDKGIVAAVQKWKQPGDLLRTVFDYLPLGAPENEGAAAPPQPGGGGPVVQAGGAMAFIEELNEEQAAENWMNEFDVAAVDDGGDDHVV